MQGKVSGKLNVREAVPKRTYSFLDYVMGGTQLNCSVAIDFTGKRRICYFVYGYDMCNNEKQTYHVQHRMAVRTLWDLCITWDHLLLHTSKRCSP